MAAGKCKTATEHTIIANRSFRAPAESMQKMAIMGQALPGEEATTSSKLIASQHQQRWSVEAVRGRRPRMEDAYCHGTISISCHEGLEQQVAIAGCFDGHGGDFVAKYMARNIPDRICNRLAGSKVTASSVASALPAAFTCLDQELQTSKQACLKGSTALVALVTSSLIHISSCGDSRAIICHNGEPVQPVQDHTPVRKDEQERIRRAGGQVLYHNGPRVMGALAMSRAIGDHALRPYGVIADPDVAHYERRPGDEFLLLASDGLWAAVSNQDAAKLVSHAVTELSSAGMSRQQITALLPKLLTKVALARGSSDNVTVLVMDLQAADSSCSPRCSSSGGNAALPEAVATQEAQGAAAAAAVTPANVCTGTGCSVTDSDVTVTAAAVERMRNIIRTAAAGSWSSSAAPAEVCSAAQSPSSSKHQQQPLVRLPREVPSADQGVTSAAAAAATKQAVPFGMLAAAGSATTWTPNRVAGQQRLVQTSSPPVPQQLTEGAAGNTPTILPAGHRPAFAQPAGTVSVEGAVAGCISEVSPFASFSAQFSRQLSTAKCAAPATADQPSAVTPPAAMESAFASPFLNHQQTVLTEVWQDWEGIQQCNSGSSSRSRSGSDNSGTSSSTGSRCANCFGSAGSCKCSLASNSNPRKRRMVTTECPGLGSFAQFQAGTGLVLGHINSAPAKLRCVGSQSHSRASPLPEARVVLPIVLQHWHVVAATHAEAQVTMSATA